MKFIQLQDNLRTALWQRVQLHQLTGLSLARQTGFQQAHISNFLNHKRGLSLDAMDRILTSQHLSVLDLLDPEEINRRASIVPAGDDEFQNIPLVDAMIAATHLRIRAMHTRERVQFRESFLKRLRAQCEGRRGEWERFVLIRADGLDASAMHPRITPGATLLIDRHFNSLKPFRRGEPNIYAVRRGRSCIVRYVEAADGQLLLRPHNPFTPIDVVTIEAGKHCSDYLVGRVCHIGLTT
jgi:Peptidase S24-like/Cro/C1-type HTH DNA-binding domain